MMHTVNKLKKMQLPGGMTSNGIAVMNGIRHSDMRTRDTQNGVAKWSRKALLVCSLQTSSSLMRCSQKILKSSISKLDFTP